MVKSGAGRSEARLLLLRGLVIVMSVLLVGRLWQLQMVQGDTFRVRADRNRFREVDVAAPRGVIYDRQGVILARNSPSFTVAIVPGDLPKTREGEPDTAVETAVLDRLLGLLATAPLTPPTDTSPHPRARGEWGQSPHADGSADLQHLADSRPAALADAAGRN